MSGAENTSEDKWTFGMRVIPGAVPRASVRNTLTYRLHPRLTAGIVVNPRADNASGKVSPLLNWLALPEAERRPALILGWCLFGVYSYRVPERILGIGEKL